MQTECPHCQTVFRITEAHLKVAQGQVRCSQCHAVFDAQQHLIEEKLEQANDSQDVDAEVDELLEDYPTDIAAKRGTHWTTLLFWAIISAMLVVTLVAQYLWFTQRDMLLQHTELRPWLERFCYVFLCALPPTRDLNSFYMQKHIAQVHPTLQNAIQFDATFTNNAAFAQPYPDLQLIFQNKQGTPIAQRRFKPTEYMHTPKVDKPMLSGVAVHIKLEIVDMADYIAGGNIMEGYSFEFL